MPSTTIRVSTSTRDALKSLADADDLTLDQQIARLARRERQRRMGLALCELDLDEADRGILDATANDAGDAIR